MLISRASLTCQISPLSTNPHAHVALMCRRRPDPYTAAGSSCHSSAGTKERAGGTLLFPEIRRVCHRSDLTRGQADTRNPTVHVVRRSFFFTMLPAAGRCLRITFQDVPGTAPRTAPLANTRIASPEYAKCTTLCRAARWRTASTTATSANVMMRAFVLDLSSSPRPSCAPTSDPSRSNLLARIREFDESRFKRVPLPICPPLVATSV